MFPSKYVSLLFSKIWFIDCLRDMSFLLSSILSFDGEEEIGEVLSEVFHCTVSLCNDLFLIHFGACFPCLVL